MHGLILDLASCHGEPIGIAASSTSTKAVRAVAAWQHIFDAAHLSPTEDNVIRRYQRALGEARRGAPPRRLARLPRTPPPSPERLGGAPRRPPNYPPVDRSSGQGTADARERDSRGYERRDQTAYDEDQRDDRRAPRSPPRYVKRGPRCPREAEDRRAGTGQYDRWAEVEAERERYRAWERLERDLEELSQQLGVRGQERCGCDRDWGAGWEQRH
ncbi:hypothetical protein PPTG_22118 [Phytophthora nicotianae INRA-310]|uniref:Uncharacterized protein n=1 Tax=Phytophthora nicotianae (strain INRA-310) TaxID=761204 RepID=W2QPI6_PHYN3|nr:hypothetical protein PPTG_22118 [Phytophthora nicotianae INRA-310]ETN14414.1 hypothetical protein PPTG_22118 [Phytophthora nicotianae INRA-310]